MEGNYRAPRHRGIGKVRRICGILRKEIPPLTVCNETMQTPER